MDSKPTLDQGQYLTFLAADEEYAIGILKVREIIQYDVVTRVPGMPPWIRGVINLRGGVVPVLDLAQKLGLPRGEVTSSTCIVIAEMEVESEAMLMGIVADSVSQVIDLQPADIEPPPAFGTRMRIDYLLGMGRAGKKFVLILDTDRLLSADELVAASELTSPTPGAIDAAPAPPAPGSEATPS